jgi:predicted regulator of Ras-like GTPase activity (Roadblock/LC7/MglB family)
MSEIDRPMQQLVDHVVDGVPGVVGAVLASADGFVLASHLPESEQPLDAAAIAAMSAASLALATRLVQLGGSSPADLCIHRSPEAQVCVFAVGGSAALTIIAERDADTDRIERIGREVARGLADQLL